MRRWIDDQDQTHRKEQSREGKMNEGLIAVVGLKIQIILVLANAQVMVKAILVYFLPCGGRAANHLPRLLLLLPARLPVPQLRSLSERMGFNYVHCQKAAINTSNTGVEEAMNSLLSHIDDPDIDDPISHGPTSVEGTID